MKASWFLTAAVAATSIAVAASFEPISHHASTAAWAILLALQLACWSPVLLLSRPALLPLGLTAWMVVLANLLITPLIGSPALHAYFSLPKNMRDEVQVAPEVFPGIEGVTKVTTDEMGFRVNKPIDYLRKDPAVLRIAAIGASTTEQIYVDDHKTWSALLADELSADLGGRKVEMINTGVSGLRAVHHLKTFDAVAKHQIDVAIFLMGVNDWNEQIRGAEAPSETEFEKFYLDRSLLWKVGLQLRGLLSHARAGGGPRYDDGSFYTKQNNSLEREQKRSYAVTEVSQDYRDEVGQIIEHCKAAQVRCVFVQQATAYRDDVTPDLRRRFWMTPPGAEYTLSLADMELAASTYNDWLRQRAASSGIDYCSLDVPATTDNFYDDCHFNDGGSRRVAAQLRACLAPRLATP